ncbi:hypothetical protein [Pseudanabaena sp. UWO310]|uniref:hypothetical protein n=1 Tax=Pseudanabaena sp. UWO310 TaxID=2480795 RepID=UPI00115AF2B5|nr:hypothetical protein [Pseudanabaena sp. UWO310]TYQ26272.1 hypothetical protein PseudUWO310_17615 [Pseudanabaena sp. UWO310]
MDIFHILFILSILIAIYVIYWKTTPEGRAYAAEREKEAAPYSIENIVKPLKENPDDISYANSIPSLLNQGSRYYSYNYGTIYNLVLEVLSENPDKIHIKTLCLTIGRLHYGKLRPDNKITIYDEQAIQNDILMRSK